MNLPEFLLPVLVSCRGLHGRYLHKPPSISDSENHSSSVQQPVTHPLPLSGAEPAGNGPPRTYLTVKSCLMSRKTRALALPHVGLRVLGKSLVLQVRKDLPQAIVSLVRLRDWNPHQLKKLSSKASNHLKTFFLRLTHPKLKRNLERSVLPGFRYVELDWIMFPSYPSPKVWLASLLKPRQVKMTPNTLPLTLPWLMLKAS